MRIEVSKSTHKILLASAWLYLVVVLLESTILLYVHSSNRQKNDLANSFYSGVYHFRYTSFAALIQQNVQAIRAIQPNRNQLGGNANQDGNENTNPNLTRAEVVQTAVGCPLARTGEDRIC